jgi:2-hydroxychromene-2-carboxylate isomerase
MSDGPAPIEFYFDFSSPYGYIASRLIDDIATGHGRSMVWKPILLGAIFKLTEMQPLTSIPLKGDYARLDFARTARRHGISFTMPDPFPFSSLHANRAFYWVEQTDPASARELAHALYDTAFSGGDIATVQAVVDIAAAKGIDRESITAGMASQDIKDRTRAATDEAIARGVFGSPFFIIDGEPFWGADRLDQVEKWLETGGW